MIIRADARHIPLAAESVQCCVTSPPYWGLRDYNTAGQLGLEKTPDEYVAGMVAVFREVWQTLKDDGVLWLNLGDKFAGAMQVGRSKVPIGLKPKNIVGIPWRVAFALQTDGWLLRQDIVWHKPNPMPESVQDRCTKAHEYIFMLTKRAKYYYDSGAIKEPASLLPHDSIDSRIERASAAHKKSNPTLERNGIRVRRDKQRGHGRRHAGFNDRWDTMTKAEQCSGYRNRRDVWTIATEPFREAHFAVMPAEIPRLCILASTRPGDVVLDPFAGAGTTIKVANELGRRGVGVELNPEYCRIADKRSRQLGLAL